MAEMNSKISIDVTKEDRVYSFSMQQGAPCGEAYDACFEVLQQLLREASRIAKSAEKNNKEKKEENAQEPPKVEAS